MNSCWLRSNFSEARVPISGEVGGVLSALLRGDEAAEVARLEFKKADCEEYETLPWTGVKRMLHERWLRPKCLPTLEFFSKSTHDERTYPVAYMIAS